MVVVALRVLCAVADRDFKSTYDDDPTKGTTQICVSRERDNDDSIYLKASCIPMACGVTYLYMCTPRTMSMFVCVVVMVCICSQIYRI